MDRDGYRLEWFLIVVHGYIVGVYGGALGDDAKAVAERKNGRLVHLCAYGMPYYCNQRFDA